MLDREQMIKRQKVLAAFGEFALCSDDLDAVLTEACRLVAEALGTARAKVLEIQEEGQSLFVRAGVGWAPDVVGHVRLPMSERSSETYAIKAGKPVIMQDIRNEERFELPDFIKEAGVIALVNVPIFLPGRQAYGLLQVDASEPRSFGEEDTEFLRTYATLLGPVIDRLHQVQRLRRQEESFRIIVENTLDYAILMTDAQDRITLWPPGAEAVFGWSADEVRGQPSSILFTPENREKGEDKKEVETARREGFAPDVRWHVRKDGSRIFIEGSTRALRERDGEVRGFLKIGQDVTERMRADEALKASEERFRAFVMASSDVVYRMSPDWSEMRHLEGRGFLADTAKPSVAWLDHYIHPDDQPLVKAGIERAIRTKSLFELEHRVQRPDGSFSWAISRAVPMLDEQGEITEWVGAARDISARKVAEEALRASESRAKLLLAELQHRVRNTLAVMRSITRRSAKTSESVEDYAMHLDGRIDAFARVQVAVTRNPSAGLNLEQLVADELLAVCAQEGEEVKSIGGPKVRLQPKAAETVALVIHELTTNALKYGALSVKGGRIQVSWRIEEAESGPRLVFGWLETGMTLSGEPPTRRGFGMELIEHSLAYELGGEAELRFDPQGLHYIVALPLTEQLVMPDDQHPS